MKVRFSVVEMLTYSGVLEMTEDEYAKMDELEEDALGEALLDRVNRKDPSNWRVESVDEFEPVKE